MNKQRQILERQSIIKRLYQGYIKHYGKYFFYATGCMVLTALATATLPFLLKPIFDEIFNGGNTAFVIPLSAAIFIAFVLKGAASYGQGILMTYVGQKIISDIQCDLFRHLMKVDLSFFHSRNSGELLSRFTNDTNLMRNAVANTVIGVGKDAMTLVFLIGVMFYRDWFLASIAFFVLPLTAIPIYKIGRGMRKVTHSAQDELGRFTSYLSQIFQGIRLVKAYTTEEKEIKHMVDRTNSVFHWIFKSSCLRAAGHPIIETLAGFAVVLVIAYGGYQVMKQTRTTGDFISFLTAMILVYEPLKRLSSLNANIQEGLAAAKRIFQTMDEPYFIQNPKIFPILSRAKGDIVFENMGFTYPNGKIALENINIRVPAGQTVALVGHSGSGKSTLINLVPRFYDATQGRILIDGHDVRTLSLEALRNNVALVSQEMTLFDHSIFFNIAYGPQTCSLDDVIEASKSAAAHDFITKLPQQYESIVGENGVVLSGGQRQRICIARAILKDAPILLLDEATSALDTESERQVQAALKKLMTDRTTLVVAHRLSTIVDADMVYVLHDGHIEESGTHQQLIRLKGLYYKLWTIQAMEPEIQGPIVSL